MKRSSTLGLAMLLAALGLLHYSLRPLLGWRAPVDFLLIGILLVAVRVRPGTAALLGCAAGLAADALNPGAFGAAAIAMTAVGFGASWLKAAFFAEHVALNALFLFGGKLGFDLIYLLSERRLGGTELLIQLGVWSTLAAAITALTGLAVLVLFRPIIDTGVQRP